MFNHLFFNTILYFSGYFFLSALGNLPLILKHSLAFIAGTALWGIVSTFLIILKIQVGLMPIIFGIGITIISFSFISERSETFFDKKKCFYMELKWGLVFILFFIIAHFLLDLFWIPQLTTDSHSYIAAGKAIINNGTFPIDLPGKNFFLNAKMSLLPALISGGYLFGINLYISIFPIMAFYLSFFSMYILYEILITLNLSNITRSVLIAIGLLLMISPPAYLYHTFYIHTNMITACYFSGSIIFILKYKNNINKNWLIISSVFLGAAALVRIEMIFFSFIPISVLIADKKPDNKDFTLFLSVFMAIAFGWHFYRLSLVGLSLDYHNFGFAEASCFFLLIAIWSITISEKIYRKVTCFSPQIFTGSLLVVLFFLSFYFHSNFIECIKNLYQIICFNKAQLGFGWGKFWLILMSAIIISIPIKHNYLTSLFYIIITFILFRLIFYSTPMLSGIPHIYSGSRIILHIYPVSVIFVITLIGILILKLRRGLMKL
jgi:hypothetical protein